MNRFLLISAGILGFLGVVLGAFGAHMLEDILTEKMIDTYKSGVLYHLIHSAALLAIALLGNSRLKFAGYFFIGGIILFSFSLYIYSLTDITLFAMITPVGGVSFLIGWGVIVYKAIKEIS